MAPCLYIKHLLNVVLCICPGPEFTLVQKADKTVLQINHHPLNSTIAFPNTYPLDSDLSGG